MKDGYRSTPITPTCSANTETCYDTYMRIFTRWD